jgi:hypothetical protein
VIRTFPVEPAKPPEPWESLKAVSREGCGGSPAAGRSALPRFHATEPATPASRLPGFAEQTWVAERLRPPLSVAPFNANPGFRTLDTTPAACDWIVLGQTDGL